MNEEEQMIKHEVDLMIETLEEQLNGKPRAWTVGELREALRGLPDDMKIMTMREWAWRETRGPDTHYVHEPVTRVEDAKEYLIIDGPR
jgi:hypothetical protein